MVRLKVKCVRRALPFATDFNSKVVRLKGAARPFYSSLRAVDFNSKVVRLKVLRACGRCVPPRKFQFQSGTIKSTPKNEIAAPQNRFQFQSGTIKSKCLTMTLKQAERFQFQSGTIKRQFNK